MNSNEYNEACANLLRSLRTSAGLTQKQIAEAVDVDVKTWRHYETGASVPTVSQFLVIFRVLGREALPHVLSFLYPEIYLELTSESDTDDIRRSLLHYFEHIASDHEVRALCYLIHGGHGSNWLPQLEEFLMIDHMPLSGRLSIASLVYELYTLNNSLGKLVGQNHVMPDLSVFEEGLKKGREAAHCGKDSYTTIK